MSREKEPRIRRLAQAAGLILLLPIILPLGLFVLTLYWGHRLFLYLRVWCLWLPKGKDALVVYSDSPVWRDYMMQEVIPLLNVARKGHAASLLNNGMVLIAGG
jgi:hypothetical protein